MIRIPLALAATAAALLLVSAAAPAGTSTVVVGEIFAGGGNSGASYTNDYVELFNRSSSSVSVTGWTLQYASASSTSWDVTPLTGTIAAGGTYLVKLASNGSSGAALPAADATGTTNLAASGGKVALVGSATALSCGATAGSCTGAADLVGYGSATDYEGTDAAPALTNTTALARAGGGCTDTNDNATDFATATPTPLNTTAAAHPCGSSGGGTTGTTGAVSVGVDIQPVLALGLDRTSISFGSVVGGSTPSPVTVVATVTSNSTAGYSLTVTRSAFTPGDLPLGIGVGAGALAAVPLTGATALQLVSTSVPSAAAGDIVSTRIGFVSALPTLLTGHYAGAVTFTVVAR